MSEKKKAIDMTPEELDQWLASLPAPEDDTPGYHFSDPDPYFKMERKPRGQRPNCWFDEDGHLHAKNISAYWIPELTVTEEIGGTVYTVTGSYEGEESFIRKLERITAKKFTEKMEDHE